MKRFIDREAKRAGSMSALARQSGIARGHLYKLRNGQFEPTFRIIDKLGFEVKLSRKKEA